jgi:DNA-binding transcriptional LysR family regulator
MLGLTQLRVFEAVTRAGSFTKAAERLGITPPGVSMHIAELEKQYRVRLFERVGRKVRLTAAGETLRHYAQRIFSLAEEAGRALEGEQYFRGARLRIAASHTTAGYLLGPVWEAIHRRYPDLQVELSVHSSRQVKDRLVALEVDLGMLTEAEVHPDLVLQPYASDPLVAVIARDHPWAGRRKVTIQELASQPLILRPGTVGRDLLERALSMARVEARARMEIHSIEAIKRAVESGAGVAVLAASAVLRDVWAGYLHALQIRDPALRVTFCLGCHRDRRESPLIRAIFEAVPRLSAPVFGRTVTGVPGRAG